MFRPAEMMCCFGLIGLVYVPEVRKQLVVDQHFRT